LEIGKWNRWDKSNREAVLIEKEGKTGSGRKKSCNLLHEGRRKELPRLRSRGGS